MLKLAEPHILSLEQYVPGRSTKGVENISEWARLGSNENCLGPSPRALQAIVNNLHESHLYPTAKRALVIEKLLDHFKQFSLQANQIALGNGTSELIANLVRALVGPDEAMLYCWPTFIMYPTAANAHGREAVAVSVKPDMTYDVESIIEKIDNRAGRRPVKLVFIANPNNPTGKYLNQRELKHLMDNIPKDAVVVIDEAYIEYVTATDFPNGLLYALSRPRTIVLRTFSKIYGLAGLRLGYAIGDSQIIDLLCKVRDPFNVNAMVIDAAIAALDDVKHVADSIRHNLEARPTIAEQLRRFGFDVCDGVGNFVIARRVKHMPSIKELCDRLYLLGIIVRPLHSFGLSEWFRVSVGTNVENALLFHGLEEVLSVHAKSIAAS